MKLNFFVFLRFEIDFFDIFCEIFEEDVLNNGVECWKICFVISRIFFCFFLFMFIFVMFIVLKMIFLLMIGNLFLIINEKNLMILNGIWLYIKSVIDVRWIWGIFIIIIVFYLFIIIKYLWMLLVRKIRLMWWKIFLVVYLNKIFFIIFILLFIYILCFMMIFFFLGIYY